MTLLCVKAEGWSLWARKNFLEMVWVASSASCFVWTFSASAMLQWSIIQSHLSTKCTLTVGVHLHNMNCAALLWWGNHGLPRRCIYKMHLCCWKGQAVLNDVSRVGLTFISVWIMFMITDHFMLPVILSVPPPPPLFSSSVRILLLWPVFGFISPALISQPVVSLFSRVVYNCVVF